MSNLSLVIIDRLTLISIYIAALTSVKMVCVIVCDIKTSVIR